MVRGEVRTCASLQYTEVGLTLSGLGHIGFHCIISEEDKYSAPKPTNHARGRGRGRKKKNQDLGRKTYL